jgi:hypothetical protein
MRAIEEARFTALAQMILGAKDSMGGSVIVPMTQYEIIIYEELIHYEFKRLCCERSGSTCIVFWEKRYFPGSKRQWVIGETVDVYNDWTKPLPESEHPETLTL